MDQDTSNPSQQVDAVEQEELPQPLPLSNELISASISLISRTPSGTAHAYTRLEIHDSQITNLAALPAFPHLRYIDCADNRLVSADEVASLEFLISLNLQGNLLSSIPAGLDKKKYLQHLNLAKNKIKDISIPSWPPLLTFLNLNDNKLTDSGRIDSFPELVHLELRGNKLKSTPLNIDAPKLQRLYLAANEITSLRLVDLTALQVLNLRGNKIEILDGIEGLTSLTYLNLRSNKIENQDEVNKLQSLPALRVLVFLDNPITAIDNYRFDVISKLPRLERLDKEGVTNEERDDVFAAKAKAATAGDE